MLLSSVGVSFTAGAAQLTSGACGSGVTYSFESSTGTLTISGKGTMKDYKKQSESPFAQRKEIKKIVVEKGVKNIGSYSFWECTGLEGLTIPSTVNTIGEYAFWSCSKLNSITIPKSVKHIGYNAFAYTAYYNTDSNWAYGVLYIGDCLVATNDYVEGAYTVKDGTRLIAKYAFFDSKDLTGIKFPESITYIDEGTFSGCCDLTTAKFTSNIKSIGDSAFFNCKSLTKIVLKEGTKTIGKYAFNCCDGAKTIKLPLSLTKIDFAAFYPCESLKNVYYAGTKAQLDKIKVEKSNGPLFRANVHCTDDVKSVKLKGVKKGFKANWKKVKGAKKYEIQYSLKKDMSKAVTVKSKKNKITVKKLKSGKKYYVTVRAVRKGGKSQWTKVKPIRAK